jgi:murein DD-endopeptidase MepM/ murein hydrolase activator NlpD
MDDGREFGDLACERIARIRPTSVRLAIAGAPERPGVRTVAVVEPEKFTLRSAVKAAAAEGLFMIAAPRQVQDPLSAFVDAGRGAAKALDAAHPGFAIAFLDPAVELNRIAAVADLSDPVTTGLSAWAAVGMASRYGTEVDVLVLGTDDADVPGDWREAMQRFRIRGDGEELVRDALERAVEHGLVLNWKPLGSPADKPAAILRAVVEGGYDLVVDDLPAISVGPKPGRRRRVQAALSQAGSSATAYRLVRDAPCGVVVVIDAARMGLVSDDVVRAGAATIALGLVGVGAAAVAPSEVTPTTVAAMPETAEGPGPATEVVAQVVPPAPLDLSVMTEADLAVMQQQLNDAVSTRDTAAAQLAEQQAAQAQAAANLAYAQSQRDALAPLADETRQKAEEATDDAKFKTIMTTGPMAWLPGSPSREEAEQAKQEAQTLSDEAESLDQQVEAWQYTAQVAEGEVADLNAQVAQTQQTFTTSDQYVAALSQQTTDLAWHLHPVAVPVAPGYEITTQFRQSGPYWSSGFHTGLDFAHSVGTDVFAAKDGVVVEVGWGGAYGNNIVIQHSDGMRTRYAHLSATSVSVGQSVGAGERIGAVGATGNVTGPHLHFEVLDAGDNFMDPAAWLGIPL